jgi:hypothetical protein
VNIKSCCLVVSETISSLGTGHEEQNMMGTSGPWTDRQEHTSSLGATQSEPTETLGISDLRFWVD